VIHEPVEDVAAWSVQAGCIEVHHITADRTELAAVVDVPPVSGKLSASDEVARAAQEISHQKALEKVIQGFCDWLPIKYRTAIRSHLFQFSVLLVTK
jgi:hypothetical protein